MIGVLIVACASVFFLFTIILLWYKHWQAPLFLLWYQPRQASLFLLCYQSQQASPFLPWYQPRQASLILLWYQLLSILSSTSTSFELTPQLGLTCHHTSLCSSRSTPCQPQHTLVAQVLRQFHRFLISRCGYPAFSPITKLVTGYLCIPE
jgi:hypothetical protein